MHFKRATSVSVADLHLQTVEDNIKRLAIDKNNQPHMALSLRDPSGGTSHAPILTVMSSARDDFNSRYDIVREIGKGGFSTVYQCRSKADGRDFAVKVTSLACYCLAMYCLILLMCCVIIGGRLTTVAIAGTLQSCPVEA